MKEKNNMVFFVIIIVLLGILLINNVESTERTVNTQGEASAEYEPDVFKATIGVQRETADVTSAEREINTVMNNIISELENMNVEIKTHDYSINPMYTGRDRDDPSTFRVRQTITVETKDLDRVNELLDVSVNNGANVVQSLRFELTDEKKEEVEASLLEEAMQKARAKAEATASAERDKVGKVLKLEIGSSGYMPYRMESFDSVMESSAPEIQPGVVDHSVRINVQFELR